MWIFVSLLKLLKNVFFFKCKCSISKLENTTNDSSSLCRPLGIVLQHGWVHCPCGLCCVCNCWLLNQTKRKERSTQLHFLFLLCYRKKKKTKKEKKKPLPFECPVSYILQISAITKDSILQVLQMLREGHTCVGKVMKYCEKARLIREVCYTGS